MYGNALIASWSRTQPAIALSSAEAEYYAVGTGIIEAQCIHHILSEIGTDVSINIHTDSTSGKSFCERLGVGRMKHIEIKYLFIQAMVKERQVVIKQINTLHNPGDIGTKHLPPSTLTYLMSIIKCTFSHNFKEESDHCDISKSEVKVVCEVMEESQYCVERWITQVINNERKSRNKQAIDLYHARELTEMRTIGQFFDDSVHGMD